MKDLSRTILYYMRAFAQAWPEIVQQLVGQLSQGHITVLPNKLDDPDRRRRYAEQNIEDGWSRNVLSTR